MKTVVITQPMFFPWVGLLEQIRLADALVYYEDVQFSKGSFTNRVQIKSTAGTKWLSVPLRDLKLGQRINEVAVDDRQPWRDQHLELLRQAYRQAPFCAEMLDLVAHVYAQPHQTIGPLAIASMEILCEFFCIPCATRAFHASQLKVPGKGSERVLAIVRHLGGSIYVTGHGGRSYLEHERFEQAGIQVAYMQYQKILYPQLHGEFTPFVSALDLAANLGREGRRVIASGTVDWKAFTP